jgi:hypothetical protein
MGRQAFSQETTYIVSPNKSRGGRGLFSFSSTSFPLMSQIYSFLGELISIHWVQLARRKKGAEGGGDLKRDCREEEPGGGAGPSWGAL